MAENPTEAAVDLSVYEDEIKQRLRDTLKQRGHAALGGTLPGVPGAQAAPDINGLVTAADHILPELWPIVNDILARRARERSKPAGG